jgi:chromosome segregation ATPase
MGVERVCVEMRGGDCVRFAEVYTTDTIDAAFGERDAEIADLRKDLRNAERRIDSLAAALSGKADVGDLNALRDQLSSHAGSIGEIYAHVGLLETWQRQAAPVIDLVNPDWVRSQIETHVAPLREQVQQAVASVHDTLAAFQNQVNAALASTESQLAGILDAARVRIDQELAGLREITSTLTAQAQATAQAVQQVASQVSTLAAQVPRMISSAVSQATRPLQTQIDGLRERLDRFFTVNLWDEILARGFDPVDLLRMR